MRILFRADASRLQGTGHVMRCLTLAEELTRRGHEVHLLTNESGVDWLETVISEAAIVVHRTAQHSMNSSEIASVAPDWVVTDSYEIPASEISALQPLYSVMAIVDGDDRGIRASLYLDHNLGSERGLWSVTTRDRLLAGSEFALIRDALLTQRRPQPWRLQGAVPHVVAVMGGSDPTGTIVTVAAGLTQIDRDFTATVVVGDLWRADVEESLTGRAGFQIVAPTSELPTILGQANIAVSAAGTSAWELCTLGVPSLLIAVVENQRESLVRLVEKGLVVGLNLMDTTHKIAEDNIVEAVERLLCDERAREEFSARCRASFDGHGKERVVDAMETIGKR